MDVMSSIRTMRQDAKKRLNKLVHPRMDSVLGKGVVIKIVIVPHNCHKNHKMARHKYNHRIKNKKYTTPLPYSWDVG